MNFNIWRRFYVTRIYNRCKNNVKVDKLSANQLASTESDNFHEITAGQLKKLSKTIINKSVSFALKMTFNDRQLYSSLTSIQLHDCSWFAFSAAAI
jgi:hypothetical protein